MKKGVAIAIISVLAALALTLGVLYYTTFVSASEKTKAMDGQAQQIDVLTADAAEKAGQIRTLTEDAAGKAGQIETLTEEVAQRDGQIDTLNKLLSSKDEEIQALTGDAADKAAQIETLAKDVADKAAQIGILTEEAAQRDGQIDTLNKLLSSRDEEIQALTGDAADKAAQIETLTKEVADKAAQIEALTKDVADRDAKIGEQEDVIAEKDQAIAELQGRVDSLTAEQPEKKPEEKPEPDGGEENRVGKKQNLPQPGTAEDRLNYTLGSLTVTLPAKIRYDQGDLKEGQRFFTDTENPEDTGYVFTGMEIEIGIDVSTLDDAMMNVTLGLIQAEIEKLDDIRNPRFERTEILGCAAMNLGFSMIIDNGEAPGYGTIIMKGKSAYVLFYAGLGSDMEEIRAEMLECLATVREN